MTHRKVTDDPATWPAWLREHNERARATVAEGPPAKA